MRAAAWAALVVALGLAGCAQDVPPGMKPIPAEAREQMMRLGMKDDAPIFIRIFKEENELEIWKIKDDGRYYLFRTYPICKWSGTLGPKLKTGDKQAPEGFYLVSKTALNPNSEFHLSFNLGFPNAFDRAHERTGAHLMVHGDCKSAGCYAMTDVVVEEIYAIAREALIGGQDAFQVHAFPFKLTEDNLARHKKNPWYPFWRDLKRGYDAFEVSRIPPKVDVCDRRYVVNVEFLGVNGAVDPRGPCPMFQDLPLDPFFGEVTVQNQPGQLVPAGLSSPIAVGQPIGQSSAAPPILSPLPR